MKVELQLEKQGTCLKQENMIAAGQRGTEEGCQAAVRFNLSNLILAHHIHIKEIDPVLRAHILAHLHRLER